VPSASKPPADESSPDPWTSARDAARSEVAAALAPRRRVCPACGHPEAGAARRCSACGADLVVRRPRRRLGWRSATAVVLGAAAVLALIVAISGPLRRDAADEGRRERARQEATEAAEIRRLRADVQPHRGKGPALRSGQDPLAHRRALVGHTERLITRDAQARARAGTLSGAVVAGTDCEPYPGITERRDAEADPAATVGRYECIAYRTKVELPELQGAKRVGVLGFPFWAVIHYRRGSIVWCKVTPRAGEGGRSLASVPVPIPCRDPLRRSP